MHIFHCGSPRKGENLDEAGILPHRKEGFRDRNTRSPDGRFPPLLALTPRAPRHTSLSDCIPNYNYW